MLSGILNFFGTSVAAGSGAVRSESPSELPSVDTPTTSASSGALGAPADAEYHGANGWKRESIWEIGKGEHVNRWSDDDAEHTSRHDETSREKENEAGRENEVEDGEIVVGDDDWEDEVPEQSTTTVSTAAVKVDNTKGKNGRLPHAEKKRRRDNNRGSTAPASTQVLQPQQSSPHAKGLGKGARRSGAATPGKRMLSAVYVSASIRFYIGDYGLLLLVELEQHDLYRDQRVLAVFPDGSRCDAPGKADAAGCGVSYKTLQLDWDGVSRVLGAVKSGIAEEEAIIDGVQMAEDGVLRPHAVRLNLLTDSAASLIGIRTAISQHGRYPKSARIEKIAIAVLRLERRGWAIDMGWVEGHKDCAGNIIADMLAKYGSASCLKGVQIETTFTYASTSEKERTQAKKQAIAKERMRMEHAQKALQISRKNAKLMPLRGLTPQLPLPSMEKTLDAPVDDDVSIESEPTSTCVPTPPVQRPANSGLAVLGHDAAAAADGYVSMSAHNNPAALRRLDEREAEHLRGPSPLDLVTEMEEDTGGNGFDPRDYGFHRAATPGTRVRGHGLHMQRGKTRVTDVMADMGVKGRQEDGKPKRSNARESMNSTKADRTKRRLDAEDDRSGAHKKPRTDNGYAEGGVVAIK